jgi:cation transport protein ChaC
MTDDADRAPDAPQACEPAISLTREFLMQNTLSEMMARAMPDVRLLSEAEREASLTDMLARRPPDQVGQGVWVFAYGSLIWNPAVHFAERRPAVVPGWQRAFCLSVRSGRGTQEQPGLMLGLVPGGLCAGAAFRIAEHEMRHELSLLWRREMLADGYIPRWVSLEHEGVAFASGIAFTVNPNGPNFCGDVGEGEVVRRLATARGSLGTGAEYLFRTRDGLRSLAISDPLLERLATKVAELQTSATSS